MEQPLPIDMSYSTAWRELLCRQIVIDIISPRSVLAEVPQSELETLKVTIRRNEIIGNGPSLPLERSIDDPSRICSYVHYRKDKHKRPEPPIFGNGIKVNQDFYENRRVFTHGKERSRKSSTRNTRTRSRSKSRSRERCRKRSCSRRRSFSKHRSRSREHKYSSERLRYKDESRHRSRRSSRQSRSASRSKSPLEYDPLYPMHGERAGKKKFLTPLRPGEYISGHPDLALRNKRPRSRSRSGSYEGRSSAEECRKRSSSRRRSFSKHRSRSREHKYSSERLRYKDESRHRSRRSSRQSRFASRSKNPLEYDPLYPMHGERAGKKKFLTPLRPGEYISGHPDLALRNKRPRSRSRSRSYEGRSRSPPDRYRRRSRSPYSNRSPAKRFYKGDKSRSPRRRSRSPHYKGSHGEHMHEEYGYDRCFPGPRKPEDRGGYPSQPFYAPAFYPRGMIPGPVIPPGHMLVPRSALMAPYGLYRPYLPIYKSGAVGPRGPGPSKLATVTSEKEMEGDGEKTQVVMGAVKDGNTETVEENAQVENAQEKTAENVVDENGDKENVVIGEVKDGNTETVEENA